MPTDESLQDNKPLYYDTPEYRQHQVRADAIRRDIYARHRFPDAMPVEDSSGILMGLATPTASYSSAWSSPEQKAEGRKEYVLKATPGDELPAWGRSEYLMSPGAAEFHKNYGRDATFLSNVAQPSEVSNTLRQWDRNQAPLHRRSVFEPNTIQNSGGWKGMATGLTEAIDGNTDNPLVRAVHSLNRTPHAIRLYQSGDAKDWSDAYKQSNGFLELQRQTQLHATPSHSPVNVDGVEGEDAHLIHESLHPPHAAQRYGEKYGQVPPGFITDAIDAVTDLPDETMLLSLLFPSSGLLKGLGKGAAGQLHRVAVDAAQDAVGNIALTSAGNLARDRTWKEYLLGGHYNGPARTYEDVKAAADERRRWGDKAAQGVSTPDQRMYTELLNAGRLPQPVGMP
jgi:hypothetical protein